MISAYPSNWPTRKRKFCGTDSKLEYEVESMEGIMETQMPSIIVGNYALYRKDRGEYFPANIRNLVCLCHYDRSARVIIPLGLVILSSSEIRKLVSKLK